MSVRSSAETFGLPTRLRDRQRQYVRNPARCQRMMVSGLTIATTSRTDGNQRQSQTNRKRSVLLRCGRFGVRRRSTLTCCRRTRFSASSVALALKLEARIPRISLNRSVIRLRAYAVRLLRLRRIEFSVHTARSFHQFRRFHRVINSNKVFGTHRSDPWRSANYRSLAKQRQGGTTEGFCLLEDILIIFDVLFE